MLWSLIHSPRFIIRDGHRQCVFRDAKKPTVEVGASSRSTGSGTSGSRIGRTDRVCPSGCAIAQSSVNRDGPHQRSGNAESVPVLDLITQMCQRIREPLTVFESNLTATEAVGLGWASLREVFRRWNIREQEDLTIWFRREGFPGAQPGNHISARAQEHLLTSACREDARVALLESVYVDPESIEPPTTVRRSSQPIAGESASSVGRPVAPVGPVRFGECVFVESAHAESMPSFLEKSVPRVHGSRST